MFLADLPDIDPLLAEGLKHMRTLSWHANHLASQEAIQRLRADRLDLALHCYRAMELPNAAVQAPAP